MSARPLRDERVATVVTGSAARSQALTALLVVLLVVLAGLLFR